jgi:outer membrane lipoprotein carrier protein
LSNPTKLNFGSRATIVCTIACAIAALTAIGLLTASRLRAEPEPDIQKILKGVEDRYNRIQTLEVKFTEKSAIQGRTRTEEGELYLRKPGRMRWQYTQPAGKLFVSDGKFIYLYTPSDHRYQRMPLKETEDMRAPLAFLLGRIHFNDDFREFTTLPDPDGDHLFITAIPKSDKLPYTEVTFLVSPDSSVIHWLRVVNQDGSREEFVFEHEQKNLPLRDGLFKFAPPPGAEFVDSAHP